jgi:hypothetical protein
MTSGLWNRLIDKCGRCSTPSLKEEDIGKADQRRLELCILILGCVLCFWRFIEEMLSEACRYVVDQRMLLMVHYVCSRLRHIWQYRSLQGCFTFLYPHCTSSTLDISITYITNRTVFVRFRFILEQVLSSRIGFEKTNLSVRDRVVREA